MSTWCSCYIYIHIPPAAGEMSSQAGSSSTGDDGSKPAESARQNNLQRIQQRKQQVYNWQHSKKVLKLAIYSACQVNKLIQEDYLLTNACLIYCTVVVPFLLYYWFILSNPIFTVSKQQTYHFFFILVFRKQIASVMGGKLPHCLPRHQKWIVHSSWQASQTRVAAAHTCLVSIGDEEMCAELIEVLCRGARAASGPPTWGGGEPPARHGGWRGEHFHEHAPRGRCRHQESLLLSLQGTLKLQPLTLYVPLCGRTSETWETPYP